MLPGVCGILVGFLYRLNFLRIRKAKVSKFLLLKITKIVVFFFFFLVSNFSLISIICCLYHGIIFFYCYILHAEILCSRVPKIKSNIVLSMIFSKNFLFRLGLLFKVPLMSPHRTCIWCTLFVHVYPTILTLDRFYFQFIRPQT